jgi:hypothetical protein
MRRYRRPRNSTMRPGLDAGVLDRFSRARGQSRDLFSLNPTSRFADMFMTRLLPVSSTPSLTSGSVTRRLRRHGCS